MQLTVYYLVDERGMHSLRTIADQNQSLISSNNAAMLTEKIKTKAHFQSCFCHCCPGAIVCFKNQFYPSIVASYYYTTVYVSL
jgi:hypothetical protein